MRGRIGNSTYSVAVQAHGQFVKISITNLLEGADSLILSFIQPALWPLYFLRLYKKKLQSFVVVLPKIL